MGRNRANKSRFIADENIPVDAVELLRNNHSIDIRHITEVAGRGLKDSEVIELSAKEDSVIITFDRDLTLVDLQVEKCRVNQLSHMA